ncbi:MAG: hypothetical protein CMJ83_00105 [Planctomycetes bacterium]|nr:hypothetical protein [Planctomycetota bacterium]
MALVQLSDVAHRFEGGPLILSGVTLEIEKGQKIGVIGRNGTGKSTLLKIISGDLDASDGRVTRRRGLKLAYQEQELVRDPGTTVRDEMLMIFAADRAREARLRELEDRLASAPSEADQARLLTDYDRLLEEHRTSRGYDVDQRIASVLTGLGLPERSWDQPITSFSGGEKNIIGLARILLADPELILLDEPSNHLDLDGLEWFIRWLRQSEATVVMVSHNRHLLDLTVERIWDVGDESVTSWTGNFTDWQTQKADALALQERQWKNQQRIIKRLEFQARRLRDMARAYDDPGQAKRAKAMLKRIEQMDVVERPNDAENVFNARLRSRSRHGDIALQVNGFSFAHGERVLFDDARLEITFGQRVCLMGPNGSGKTTLFNHLLREGSWENPILRLGHSVRIGDYNQIHHEVMDPNVALVDWLQDKTGLLHQPASELLHRFLFARDDLDRPVSTLSGGEKSRLQLARLVHEEANLLMLDEPTNHLDIQSCEQLESMLEEYDGTLFVISHDRYFLDRLVDTVVEVQDRTLTRFQGSFVEWWTRRQALAAERRAGALSLHAQKDAAPRVKSRADNIRLREEKKAKERDHRRLRNRVKQLEDRVAELETEKTELEQALEAAYATGGNPDDGPRLAAQLQTVRTDLETTYSAWEDAAAAIDEH